jgi:hypothetical protein
MLFQQGWTSRHRSVDLSQFVSHLTFQYLNIDLGFMTGVE